jgi:hypothetical protein
MLLAHECAQERGCLQTLGIFTCAPLLCRIFHVEQWCVYGPAGWSRAALESVSMSVKQLVLD